MDTKEKLAFQTALKHLINNPKEIEFFKKEPDEFLKKNQIECSTELKYEIANVLSYIGLWDDDNWCGSWPRPIPWPIPWLQYLRAYDEYYGELCPPLHPPLRFRTRPIPFPKPPRFEDLFKAIY